MKKPRKLLRSGQKRKRKKILLKSKLWQRLSQSHQRADMQGKLAALEAAGLEVVERVPLSIAPRAENQRYLQTKRDKLGHWLPGLPALAAGR